MRRRSIVWGLCCAGFDMLAVGCATPLLTLGDQPDPAAARREPAHNPSANLLQPTTMVAPESLSQGFILVVDDKGRRAGESSPIYFASNITGWNPGDVGFKLQPQSDLKWRIVLKQPPAGTTVEFKFTRGTWDLVEVSEDLKDVDNRTLPKVDVSKLGPGEQPVIELTVAKWHDQRPDEQKEPVYDPYRPIPVTGTLKRVQFVGGSGGAEGLMREAPVWLPPGYEEPVNRETRYPVLYMFDAQNLFAKHAGIRAEWGMDETASKLISEGRIAPLIIVGLPHGGAARMSEYLPVEELKGVKPSGEQFVRLVLDQVKPRIDTLFRTRSGPANTAIGGSSLGAAMAVYAATAHPDVFGSVLAESLPFGAKREGAWNVYLEGVKVWPARVYLGVGGQETGPGEARAQANAGYVAAVKDLDARLGAAGLGSDRRMLVIDPQAEHNEAAWNARLPGALTFLFPPPAK